MDPVLRRSDIGREARHLARAEHSKCAARPRFERPSMSNPLFELLVDRWKRLGHDRAAEADRGVAAHAGHGASRRPRTGPPKDPPRARQVVAAVPDLSGLIGSRVPAQPCLTPETRP